MGVFAERLLTSLQREQRWPPPSQQGIWNEIEKWIAFRESDRDALRTIAGWPNNGKRYHVDPLPELISSAFSSLLYGSAPQVTAAAEADQDQLAAIVKDNDYGTELQRNVLVSSSEGEVWWKIYSNPDVADVPLVVWYSRLDVVPFYAAGRLVAAAFIDVLDPIDESGSVWRLLEVHDKGEVTNAVFRGTNSSLGSRYEPDGHPDTEGVRPVWTHELPMLCGRVINRQGADSGLGRSDYDGIEDFLLELNEAATIGAKNMRTTAVKRIVVTESALDENRQLKDDEIIVAEAITESMTDQQGPGPYKVLEYNFDAAALIAWQDNLATKALTRTGITPQFVGLPTGNEGLALSGTALRIRLIPSDNAAQDRGQWYDAASPHQLRLCQLVDALPTDDLGFGRTWASPEEAPSVKRGQAIPEDLTEQSDRHVALKTANLLSVEQSIRERYRDWSDEQVTAELDRIVEDEKRLAEAAAPALGPPPPM